MSRRGLPAPRPGSYDPAARAYAEKFFHELDGKPFDRAQLDALAARVAPGGWVADLGCGPGHVGRYLAGRGLRVTGYDLSEGMLAEARARSPELAFERLDLLALTPPPRPWDGVSAAYCLIHVPPSDLDRVLAAIRGAMAPGAPILASFHLGDGTLHADELLGAAVDLEFHLYRTEELVRRFRAAGFAEVGAAERDPYPEVEYPGRRAYVSAVNRR